jgi:TRAP-type C4-dicarboxylate transport system permease small subunit
MITVFAMMALMVLDVCVRFVTGKPILGTFEIVEVLMVVIVFMSLANTQIKKGHINLDMFITSMPKKISGILYIVIYALAVVMSAIMVRASFREMLGVYHSHKTTATLQFSVFPFHIILFVGVVFLFLVFIVDMVLAFGNMRAIFGREGSKAAEDG